MRSTSIPPKHLSSPGLSSSVDISQLTERLPRTVLPPPRLDKKGADIHALLPPPLASSATDIGYLYLCCDPLPVDTASASVSSAGTLLSASTTALSNTVHEAGVSSNPLGPQRHSQSASALDGQSLPPAALETISVSLLFSVEDDPTETRPLSSVLLPVITATSLAGTVAEASESSAHSHPSLKNPGDESHRTTITAVTVLKVLTGLTVAPSPSLTHGRSNEVVFEQFQIVTQIANLGSIPSFRASNSVQSTIANSPTQHGDSNTESAPPHRPTASEVTPVPAQTQRTSSATVVTDPTNTSASIQLITICVTTTLGS